MRKYLPIYEEDVNSKYIRKILFSFLSVSKNSVERHDVVVGDGSSKRILVAEVCLLSLIDHTSTHASKTDHGKFATLQDLKFSKNQLSFRTLQLLF
jgi:hypothetical protein